MTKCLVLLCGFLYAMPSVAETFFFKCQGVTESSRGSERNLFDIRIETKPADLIGPAGPLSSCLLFLDNKTLQTVKYSCVLSESSLDCTCSGGDYFASSFHSFSRISGSLRFFARRKQGGEVLEGRYECSRINKKVF